MLTKLINKLVKVAQQMQQVRAAMVVWNQTRSVEKTKAVFAAN